MHTQSLGCKKPSYKPRNLNLGASVAVDNSADVIMGKNIKRFIFIKDPSFVC